MQVWYLSTDGICVVTTTSSKNKSCHALRRSQWICTIGDSRAIGARRPMGCRIQVLHWPPVPASPTSLTLLTKLCDGMNRQMQANLSLSDTPELIAAELLEQAIINWRDVPSIAKLMTMGFIQRANETAEYLAAKDGNLNTSEEPNSAATVQSEVCTYRNQ